MTLHVLIQQLFVVNCEFRVERKERARLKNVKFQGRGVHFYERFYMFVFGDLVVK